MIGMRIITSSYHGGSGLLKLDTVHHTVCTNSKRDHEFRMTQFNGWDLTGNRDSFRQGAMTFRNAREWAKEERERLIIAANDKALNAEQYTSSHSFLSSTSNDPPHPDSETSADELAIDGETRALPTPRTTSNARVYGLRNTSANRRGKKR